MFEVLVSDPSQVAEARRRTTTAAGVAGFGEVTAGQAALVATELCSNLLKHGQGGCLLVNAGNRSLDLLALDSGSGMADVEACMADGYSTAGSRGQGLGAVRRLAQSGTAQQKAEAERLMPLVDAQLAERKARAPVRKAPAGKAVKPKKASA